MWCSLLISIISLVEDAKTLERREVRDNASTLDGYYSLKGN